MQQRLSDLTADGRMNRSEAMRQIHREDNAQLVKMNIEKAAQERESARKAEAPAQEQAPAEPAQPRALKFSEDRQPHSLNHNLLKKEQAELTPQQREGRTLTFSEDKDKGRELDRGR